MPRPQRSVAAELRTRPLQRSLRVEPHLTAAQQRLGLLLFLVADHRHLVAVVDPLRHSRRRPRFQLCHETRGIRQRGQQRDRPMADQRGGRVALVEVGQQPAQRRALQQVLHRCVATGNVDRIEARVALLLDARQADHRRGGRRGQRQLLQQLLVQRQLRGIVAEVRRRHRGRIHRRRPPLRRGEGHLVARVQQQLDRLHQLVEIEAGGQHPAVLQVQVVFVGQHHQHVGGMRAAGGQGQGQRSGQPGRQVHGGAPIGEWPSLYSSLQRR